MRGKFAILLLTAGVAFLAACGEEEPAIRRSPPPAPPPQKAVVAPRGMSTSHAFDLVLRSEGALLVWGPSGRDGGARLVPLDDLGGSLGPERVIAMHQPTAEVPISVTTAISAAAGGGKLAVVWVAREGRETFVRASHGPDDGVAFAPPLRLARFDEDVSLRSGLVAAAAAPDGTLSVIYRAGKGRCPDGEARSCTRFGIRRLGEGQHSSVREGVGLAVPQPCDSPLVGYQYAGDTWYYGLCARTGDTLSTTTYAIRFDPEYAQADRLLVGSVPLGMSPLGEAAVVMAGLGPEGNLNLEKLSRAGTVRSVFNGVRRVIKCMGGRPELVLLDSSQQELRQPLTSPVGRLEALLPERIAPKGSRAVWTGAALLVAQAVGRDVSIRRFQCDDRRLVRTDPP